MKHNDTATFWNLERILDFGKEYHGATPNDVASNNPNNSETPKLKFKKAHYSAGIPMVV
jgi:hypothetical protein